MALKDNEIARRAGSAIECRSDAVRLNWTFTDLVSSDAHALACRFACSSRIAENTADRRMFAEVFLGARESVTTGDVAGHFSPGMRAGLAMLAARHSAADSVAGLHKSDWISALIEAARPIAFATGLELLPPFQLDLESPTLQRQRLDDIARQRANERASGLLHQLQQATELLKQFQQMRQAAPELPAGTLLERMHPADRGPALQTLLLASSNQAAATLFAVSGRSLVRIDPRQTPPAVQQLDLPDTFGPLRSVQPATQDAKQVLLVGARGGVIVTSPENPSDARLYAHSGLESVLGFNAVTCTGEWIWASHSEAGIVGWDMQDTVAPKAIYIENSTDVLPAAPATVVPSGSSSRVGSSSPQRLAGAKNLHQLDASRLIYSVANELIVREGEARTALPAQSQSEILSILPAGRSMVAVHQDGTLVLIDRATGQITQVRRRGSSRLSAAGTLPWLGDARLLLANEDGPIDCVGLDDSLTSEFLSSYRGLKLILATVDLVAALSPDRQRIILWHAWDGQRPIGEVHITSRTRHRVADLAFVTA